MPERFVYLRPVAPAVATALALADLWGEIAWPVNCLADESECEEAHYLGHGMLMGDLVDLDAMAAQTDSHSYASDPGRGLLLEELR